MKKIGFLELSNVFANQAKLPYSTGCVWSYCIQNKLIADSISFDCKDWHYILDEESNYKVIADSLLHCDIVGVSYFVWNSSISDKICKTLKALKPNITIVYGGLGIPRPEAIQEFLLQHDYVDYAVHNEGEYSFELLLLYLTDNISIDQLKGISSRNISYTPISRVKDINAMPSPYLNGLFDNLISSKAHSYNFEGIIEPERGCPYSCTFCEVGDSYFTKIAKHDIGKILSEIDWLSNNKVEYVHIVDNNFGMYKDHLDIAKYLVRNRDLYGYPSALNITWAKNKKEHLYDIADLLQREKLNKGVTIALQSLNPSTLKAIKRSNSDLANLSDILATLNKLRIPAFIELIIGLPEETVESFKDGIYYLLDEIGYVEYMTINNMIVLPNSPFSEYEYLQKYDIKTSRTAPLFAHHSQPEHKLLEEYNLVVTQTSSMSFQEYVELNLWKWFMLSTHFLGWTRVISKQLKDNGISYRSFYEKLFEHIKSSTNSLLHSEFVKTEKSIISFFTNNSPWGRKMPDISNLYWEYEEATAIAIAQNKKQFYNELSLYLSNSYPNLDISNIITSQSNKMKDPYIEYGGDLERWCIECMWWGRRVERFFVGEYFDR